MARRPNTVDVMETEKNVAFWPDQSPNYFHQGNLPVAADDEGGATIEAVLERDDAYLAPCYCASRLFMNGGLLKNEDDGGWLTRTVSGQLPKPALREAGAESKSAC